MSIGESNPAMVKYAREYQQPVAPLACVGCKRLIEGVCTIYPKYMVEQWRRGKCAMATHTGRIVENQEHVRVGQQKQSRKKKARK